jgi:glutamyl-tRNA synthetase
MAELKTRIEAHALANALKYDGKANPGNVLPKVIGEFPEVKKDIPGVRKQIDEMVAKVNAMSLDAQRARLEEIAPELLEKKEKKERDLPPLPNAVDGKVVTRIPPEPSKYNHLGHALTFLLNSTYAERYHGKVILRFEDANPDKVSQEFVDMMLDDITNYLGIKPAAIRFVSDDMPTLQDYARKLIAAEGAYMCFCDREIMAKGREEGTECEHRQQSADENLKLFEEFLAGKWQKGEAVLRFRGDMQSQNTVLRDPVLWRSNTSPHFRQGTKYKVWPTYDFYSGPEEALSGVTHVLRSNEFDLRVELQQLIKQRLGLPDQEVLQYGRFNVTGTTTQGREIRALIASGNYLGWDDPRLATLKALKRRGIKREAFQELLKTIGLSPYPINLDFTMLAAANRKFIENVDRYSFVADPKELVIDGAQQKEIELDSHPDRKGGRPVRVAGRVFVSNEDHMAIAGKKVRLMGLATVADDGKGNWSIVTYEQVRKGHDVIVNWVSAENGEYVPVQVMMPDATLKTGLAEKNIARLKVDDIIQFERFGFCRLDAVEDGVWKFWFTHK